MNPLIDDADAFRLAVELRLSIERPNCMKIQIRDYTKRYLSGPHYIEEDVRSGDTYSATRLAIVRNAAEIGKSLP